jgi:hypothetical protein
MSETAITLVELDVAPDVAAQRAEALTGWLLAEGVVVRNPTPDPLWQPSAFLPGPRSGAVAPDAAPFVDLANRGVDVIARRELHHPAENYEPPPCPVCRTPIEADEHRTLIEPWLAGTEPAVTCHTCGETNRIGDWSHRFTYSIGNLAVRFNNWTPLSDEFTTELGSRLGSRWRLVLKHA